MTVDTMTERTAILEKNESVEIHIEELVLYGFGQIDHAELGRVVVRVLSQLLDRQDLSPLLQQGGSADRLDGGSFMAPADAGAHMIGRQIAAAITRSFRS